MYGPGYVLSWDLVTWLSDHREDLQEFMHVFEDMAISEMLKWGGKAKDSWVTVKPGEYMNHPSQSAEGNDGTWVRNFGSDVILYKFMEVR